MKEHIVIEGYTWTVASQVGVTEKAFVELYMNEGHTHIYEGMKLDDKRKCLKLAWKMIQNELPKPVAVKDEDPKPQ